ncbi:MAG: phosphocholine cytidylyltransferase family protein [Ignavibacteriae bacterium]|nr:phosphocholine cytidylyltransferase family protein [Ignavibacteriota bacterium]
MQAVILAAGIAKRLRPLTDTTPKCLLNVGETNLLHRTIDNIIENGIKDFVFVTGYRENMIKEYLERNFTEINKIILTNPDYENNNNSYSLWMTKEYVKGEMLLLDSDILFDKGIIAKLLNSGHGNCLAVNFTEKLDAEQIKVIVDKENKILEIGKEISIEQSIGESIGIEKFSINYLMELYNILDRKIVKENNVNEFYEASFQEIINRNDAGNSIYSVDVSEYECMEIDTAEDYYNACNLYKNKKGN